MTVDYTIVPLAYDAVLGAHGLTQRIGYAVPQGKSARIKHICAWILNGNGNAANSGSIKILVNNAELAITSYIAVVQMPAGNVPAAIQLQCDIPLHCSGLGLVDTITAYTQQTPAPNSEYHIGIIVEEY